MKKFLCLTASVFVVAASALAGNNTLTTPKASAEKTACCKGKTCCEKKACCSSEKSACSHGMPSKSALISPKAAAGKS